MRGAELGEREKEGWVEKFRRGDFPADPVVKTPHFQWGGGEGAFHSWSGKIPHAMWHSPKLKKKKKMEEKSEEGRRERELKQEHQS